MTLLRVLTLSVSVLAASNTRAEQEAFRLTDLDLRDPHYYISFISCIDVTDTGFLGFNVNGDTQTRIQTDGDGNGFLDYNLLIVFDDVDPSASSGTLELRFSNCTAPMSTTWCDASGTTDVLPYAAGLPTCLEPILGTLYGPYTPEVTTPSAPCFVTNEATVIMPFYAGVPITLRHAQIGGTYVGNPPTQIVNGLIQGFITETDANATILPASLPVVGGQPLSILLPGGDPPGAGNTNCSSHSDKDFVDGVPGWWFYWNFTAALVPYPGAPTGLETSVARGVAIHAAVPNPFNPSTTIRYAIDAEAFVSVSVYDANGRFVADVVREHRAAGDHQARWNGTTSTGATASSGVYFVRLEAGGKSDTRKIVLLK
ncbi:MAG TPA: T9SS type A sorting domain-containing protein [Candidatus Krumholzibacteria bacterium]|nr:T9SS type A sorting domain-containing protein [Candidatus Krumholzibacteria bacterium]